MRLTQIVEFNGLPGCGKTTLCDEIQRTLTSQLNIAYVRDASKSIKEMPLTLRMRRFPFKECFFVICLYLTSPPLAFRDIRMYKSLLKFVINYKLVQCLQNYDILLEDHGLIQRVVSFFYKREKFFKSVHIIIIKKLYEKLMPSKIVYCDISAETALLRMIKRNRKVGRIDRIKDHNEKLGVLQKQMQLFRDIIDDTNLVVKKEFVKLDMEKSTLQIVNDFFQNEI